MMLSAVEFGPFPHLLIVDRCGLPITTKTLIERVPWRATKLVQGIRHFGYDDSLQCWINVVVDVANATGLW